VAILWKLQHIFYNVCTLSPNSNGNEILENYKTTIKDLDTNTGWIVCIAIDFFAICTPSTSLSLLLPHHCHFPATLPPPLNKKTHSHCHQYFLYHLPLPKHTCPTPLGCIPSLFAPHYICPLVLPYPKVRRQLWQIIFHPLPYLFPVARSYLFLCIATINRNCINQLLMLSDHILLCRCSIFPTTSSDPSTTVPPPPLLPAAASHSGFLSIGST